MIYKTLHRKLKIEQHEPPTPKNPGCFGRISSSCSPSGIRRVILVFNEFNIYGQHKLLHTLKRNQFIQNIMYLLSQTRLQVPIYKIGLYYTIEVNFLLLHTPNMSENVLHTKIPNSRIRHKKFRKM